MSNYANTTNTWVSTQTYSVGTSITLTCDPGFEYAYESTEQLINCTDAGWNYTGILPCHQSKNKETY